jgi:hypothetical protein
MLDDVFDQPLLEYERLYSEYFRIYCTFLMTPVGDPAAACLRPLLASLKRQAFDWRCAMFELAHSRSGVWRRPVQRRR